MEKNNNTNFKFSIVDLIIVLLLTIMFLLGGLFYNNYKELNNYFNIKNTLVDFIIQTPSREQITQISNMKHIENVTPYLYSAVDSQIDNEIVRINLYIVEKEEDLSNTPFSDELLKEYSKKNFKNELYISDDLSKTHSLKIGDEIIINAYSKNILYNVKGIYLGDRRNAGGLAFSVKTGDIDQAIDHMYGKEYKYSGAYINSINYLETEKWLEDYKPLGDLRTRDEFDSDELYQIYLENRNKTDYTLSTFYKEKYLNEVEKRYDSKITRNLMLSIAIQIISFVLMIILLIVRVFKYIETEVSKDWKNNFTFGQEQQMFNIYFKKILIVCFVTSILLMLFNKLLFNILFFEYFNIINFVITILIIIIVWLLQYTDIKKRFYS